MIIIYVINSGFIMNVLEFGEHLKELGIVQKNAGKSVNGFVATHYKFDS